MKYSAQTIGEAFKKERWGGVCYINICGQGETLVPKETLEITRELLKQGHYVNITTNGTLSKRFDELADFPKDYLQRLNFAFSFHYLELLRLNLLDTFFNNINIIRNLGCSFVLQLNLCDEYIPYIDEIKKISLERLGAYPQIAATRKEINLKNHIELLTEKTYDEYCAQGKKFNSPLFDFTMKNLNVKQNHFCYAGDWSFQLNLADGIMRRCYSSNIVQNIFDDVTCPIRFVAMGYACKELYCINSSHFMSLGIIPTINTPSYAELRDRPEAHWYSEKMRSFLDSRLYESNEAYTLKNHFKTFLYYLKEQYVIILRSFKSFVKKLLVKLNLYNPNIK